MEVSDQPHAWAASAQGQSPCYTLNGSLGEPQSWSGHFVYEHIVIVF
jgi:hypothetical protein